ncbi:hypothetical protein P691DRAFT_701467 [Macrolepiota fuliginosa MF-IS2]|uniref:Uncharacterized protein n=1 Tax=Macrolepiota fuliginosa MF-IS2 TaxID=1400762 RepID=A0A9P6C367_9AGAR|nr:hypothetical protein P691DRAFT_701467 [Macrolepiota fuliginosa MF-IS2]
MTAATRAFAWLALLLSLIYYRSGEVIKNSILVKSPLPKGYIAGGDFGTDCKDIGSPATPEIASCEDAAFWDLHDASGKLTERRLVLGCDLGRHNWNTVMGPLRDPNPRATLWLYSESTTGAPNTASHSTGAKEKAAGLLDKIRGTVNKKSQETTKSTKEVPKPKLQQLELRNYPEGHDFHPLGLEVWPSYGGNGSYLYAVNHARARTVIEQFLLEPAEPTVATHIRTISHSWFISPNALALTSPDSFYVSNDHLFTRRLPILGKFIPIIETLLGLPFSFVAHVTLNPPSSPPSTPTIAEHTIEAPFIPFSNGVSLSPGGGEVAIASTTLNRVLFYARDKATNRLTYKTAVPVPFCPDNVHYYAPESHDDEAAKLIVAGHPHFPSVIEVTANKPGAVGQSWVLSITRRPDASEDAKPAAYDMQAPFSANEKVPVTALPKGYAVETVFQSNGTGFSTGATGLEDSLTGTFYITGLYAPQGAMVCHPHKSG